MPGTIQGKTQPWFTISEFLSESVAASTSIDVSKIAAVSFDGDVNITVGSLPTTFSLPSGTALGIDSSTETIEVDANVFMFAMGGR